MFVDKVLKASYWKKAGSKMRFDAVVGNPPYDLMDGGSKASAVPIYNLFVTQAIAIDPKYLSMIMPAKWFTGGRGLDSFRDAFLNDTRIRSLFDIVDADEVFPEADIAGGVCYFLWDSAYKGYCHVTTINHGKRYSTSRALNEFNVFVRHTQAMSIIERIRNIDNHFYDEKVSA